MPRWGSHRIEAGLHGSRGFRIITSAKGLRSMALGIGDRIVVGSVDDVRATISHFIGCDRP